jgi:hypothetical protein
LKGGWLSTKAFPDSMSTRLKRVYSTIGYAKFSTALFEANLPSVNSIPNESPT